MKNYLKNPKLLAAVIVVVIAILGGLVFSLNNDKQVADKPKNETVKQEESDDQTGQVAAAETAQTDTGAVVDTGSEPSNTPVTTVKTASVTTQPAAPTTPATPQQPPAVTPPTPETPTEEEPQEDPEDLCELEGRVLVQAGGVSCSYTLGTEDGLSAFWLPASIDKPNADVRVVIESQIANTEYPYLASYVVFHFAASANAPLGDYVDQADGLTFGEGISYGTPEGWIFPTNRIFPQLTIVE